MKKQTQSARSKANNTQERLIAREAFQYVAVNPKKYGTVSNRNERQLATKMNSLHVQQNKRLAKLTSQIHEVKVHRWKLKEVDETTRDPRTTEEKLLGPKTEGVSDMSDTETKDRVLTRGRIARHSGHTQSEEGLVLRKTRPMTSGDIYSKNGASRFNRNGDGRTLKQNRVNGYTIRQSKANNLYNVKTTIVSNRQPSGSTQGISTTAVYGLKDLPVKRDAHYKYKSYNLMSVQKSMRERLKSPRELSKQKKESRNELESTNDSREKVLMNKNHIGQTNTRQDVMNCAPKGHRIHVGMSNDLPTLTNHGKGSGKGPGLAHLQEGSAVNNEDITEVSDEETRDRVERPAVVEEDWAETLKSCRYLRKPRGYETPEIPIESIFQDD